MRNSMDFNEIKELKGRRGIRDRSEEVNFANNRIKPNNIEDRSNSEPPRSYGSYLPATSSHRLKTIREKKIREDAQGSSDEDGELSKSNSQLNESDLDMEIPDSASASASQTPTPTPLVSSNARRINSETNLNDSKRRLSGFMGNRSKRFCASTSELSFTSHLDTQKSLFSPRNNALSRQSFNSSLYGSNMSLSSTNSRLFMANSPFYNGKTMFGGASAYPKRDINQHKILRTPVQMRPSSSLSNSSNTSAKSDNNIVPESNAAKRILEIMNQFSGPLKEARSMGNNINAIIKVPSLVQSRKRYGEDELNLDRSIALSSPSAPYSRPLSGAPSKNRPESPLFNSASAKPLQIPTMSQLLQMKRLQNNTEKVREIASRSESFLNQNHEYKLPSSGDDTHSNPTSGASLKMKSNITKNLLRPDKNSANDQLPALPLNLPNIQLPAMKSIPKFDIPLTPVSVASKPASPALSRPSLAMSTANAVSKVPEVQFNFQNSSASILKEKTKEGVAQKNSFVLSKPLPAGDGSVNISSLNHINEKFIFSEPIIITDDDKEVDMSIVAKSPVKSSLSSPATDNLFKNLVAQQKSSSWECDSCLTRNDAGKTNCVCCDSSKPGTSKATQAPVAADDLFKSLAAKQKQSQWECDSCMTKNDVSKDKCGCCETGKPGSKPAPASLAPVSKFTFGMTQPVPTNDDLFKNLAAQQKQSQWECDACMSRNDASKDSCACCTTPRPGAKPQQPVTTSSFSFGMKPAADSTAVKPTFSFGMPQATSTSTTDAGFKKIVEKQSVSWECSACLTRNESSKMECVCCEQAKPGSGPATPQFSFGSKMTSLVVLPPPSEVKFSFGMQAAKIDIPVEAAKKVEEVIKVQDEVDKPKPTFSFGMNNLSPVENAKSSEPAVNVAVPAFTFKSPASATSVSASITLGAAEKKNDEKKEEAKPAAPMFTFGAQKEEAVVENKITFGSEIKAAEPITAKQPEKEEVKKADFGGFKFGADTPLTTLAQAPTPTLGNALNKNGGFSFGFGAKPAEAPVASEPIKTAPAALPSVTAAFSFGSSATTVTSFGSTAAIVPPATNSFFGASKPENEAPKTFGSFGATSSPAITTFGIASTQSTPVFGQSNASTGGFSFSAKKEEAATAQQPSIFAFGSKPTATESAPMLFGNANQTNQAQNVTPVFGASSTPTFGSSMTTNNNNESGFGSKMPSFGNTGQPQKRAFEFTNDAPQTKKFDFGAQQQQQQQASATPFQFNAQANENKPAFNFGASSQPSFNFSNPAANNPQAPATAPPIMQFGSGALQPQMGLPGINSFSAQGTTSGAAANQRKILRAARRARR